MTTCAKVGCTNQVQLPEHFCYEHPYETGRPEHAVASPVVGKVAEDGVKALKTPKELASELRDAADALNAKLFEAAQAGLTVEISQTVVSHMAAQPQRKRISLTIKQVL